MVFHHCTWPGASRKDNDHLHSGGEHMTRIYGLVGAAALLFLALITPAAARGVATHPTAGSVTVGLVLDVGGINDKSFNHLAYLGMRSAMTTGGVSGSYLPSNSGADYVPNLTHFAQLHPKLIIATGGLLSNAVYTVAKQFPKQKFAQVDGEPSDAKGNTVKLKNVAGLLFHEQESGFLVGVIAGLMEKNHVGKATHNVIGAMGGLPVPAVVRYLAGYKAGAKAVDPNIRVLIGYSQSFTNEGAGNTIGRTQIGAGADILFQVAGASGLGYLSAAQQAGRYGIGVDADQSYLGRYIITSAIKRVDLAVKQIITQTRDGHFRPGDHVFTVKNHGTGFGKVASYVPKSIVAQANKYEALMRAGKVTPPVAIPAG
jgi:basic membrane protein A and related proteins